MGRDTGDITDEQVEKARAVPILHLFQKQVVPRITHVKCPFHQERTASLAIYPDNSFYCFGCRAKGRGAIDFVMQMGSNFVDACKELQKYI